MDDIRDANPNGKLSWFAFHPADFAGETQNLTNAQVGAYFRLLCYYAQMGSLPRDESELATIARCKNVKEWRALRPSLEPLLSPDSRLATEIRIAQSKRERRVAAGSKGGISKARATYGLSSNALAKPYQPEPEPEEVRGYREEAPSSKGSSYSLEGIATVQEEASTRGNGTRAFGVVDGGRA